MTPYSIHWRDTGSVVFHSPRERSTMSDYSSDSCSQPTSVRSC